MRTREPERNSVSNDRLAVIDKRFNVRGLSDEELRVWLFCSELRSGCKIELLVVVEVVAAEFLLLVPLPVLVEVAVGDDGAQVQDGARGGPPRAGDVHPVLDEESCCAFDDPGGDLPAVGQGGGVVQVRGLGGQV